MNSGIDNKKFDLLSSSAFSNVTIGD